MITNDTATIMQKVDEGKWFAFYVDGTLQFRRVPASLYGYIYRFMHEED